MKKFEYHVESFEVCLNMNIVPTTLNALGAEGWELVSFSVTNSGNFYNAIFKREIV